MKTSEKEKYTNKTRESFEGNGVDYEEELKKSKKLEMKLRKGNKMACIEHDKLNSKSVHVEVRHEELVDKLKGKLWSAISTNEEEVCLEVEDTRE